MLVGDKSIFRGVMMEYKEFLIANILEWQQKNQFTYDDLVKMSVRALERIHDNV